MGIQFINRGGGGSGTIKPNIFVQSQEPEIKKGLWLQKAGATVENYYGDESVYIGGNWEIDGSHTDIPYNFIQGSAVSVGTDIYLFGSLDNNSSKTTAYKYDTLTNTYTQLTDIPYGFYQGSAVSIGTDIYLIGGRNSMFNLYKYNTLNNSYTQMADINWFWDGSVANVGTDIYIFGGMATNAYQDAYKYDTLTGTNTKLTKMPFSCYQGSAVSIGTDIYLFGGFNDRSCNKYDTLTDTYTQMTNIPFSFYYGSVASVGTDIYLFGSGTNNVNKRNYKYNILTDTYTELASIPYNFNKGSAVSINDEIYLLGGSLYPTKVQVFAAATKTYEENSVIITQGKYYNSTNLTELFTLENAIQPIQVGIADAWFCGSNGLETDIPTYIGDGTTWTKIKN